MAKCSIKKKIIVVIAIVVGVGSCVLVSPIAVKTIISSKARSYLLCKMDHQALLKSGRELLSHVPMPRKTTPDGYSIGGKSPIPKGVSLSQVILDLSPHEIGINYDGYLFIEMGGTMDHFGVRVYPEDFQPPDPSFKYGDRMLVDGLWYYDEDYRFKDYDKKIDAMLMKNKYRQSSARAIVNSDR